MIDQKLLSYIKQKMSFGSPKETIKIALIKAGWSELEIEEGFKEASQTTVIPMAPPQQPEKTIKSEQVLPHTNYSRKSPKKIIFSVLAVVLVLLLIGTGLYFYSAKFGLFGISPYTDKNLFSGLLTVASKINSSSYSASASLTMTKRDADAKPFVASTDTDAIKKQYENDAKRAQDVSSIINRLTQLGHSNQGTYPGFLQPLQDNLYSQYKVSIIDPLTQQPYRYALTENGNNFALTVIFETSSAISQIRQSYKFSDTTTIISGKTVTFTKDSYPYLYISSTPPKPFLVSLADMMAYVPPETKVDFSASAQSDFTNKDSTDWKFNADATGDFGDLTYKFNLDALRKDSIYYLRINNMPAFFFSYIGFEKGQWIKVDPSKASSSGNYSYFSDLSATEKSYKEHRQEITDALKKVITIADSESLFTFKNAPHQEMVDSRRLYRYDLLVNKSAIVPFYKKLLEEYSNTNISSSYSPLTDNGYLEYLQSPEFSEIFDYYQKNTTLTLWVDSDGYPAIVSYGMRIVPGDSVVQLKDKQANLVFKLTLSDINKPVKIDAPTDAKNFEDILQSNPYVQQGQDAAIKGNLSTILTNGAVYYDTHNSYANFCASTGYTQPATAVTNTGGNSTCKVNVANSAFCACSSLKSVTGDVFCVDSTGMKRQSTTTCANACTINGICK